MVSPLSIRLRPSRSRVWAVVLVSVALAVLGAHFAPAEDHVEMEHVAAACLALAATAVPVALIAAAATPPAPGVLHGAGPVALPCQTPLSVPAPAARAGPPYLQVFRL